MPLSRPLLLPIVLLAGGIPAASAEVVVVDTTNSPHALLLPVGVDEVTWTHGFWAERTRVCRDRSIPAMWDIMRGTQYKPFLKHFLIAAGKADGDYHGAAWNDGDFYKWLEAASVTVAVENNDQLAQAVATSIGAIAAAQREDGYLHTPVLIRQRNGDPTAKPLSDRHDFEVYNLGHLMTTGCICFRATGNRELLEVAERAAGFLENAFSNPTPELARNSVCPSHYMGVVELYRTTGDPRYLHLAQNLFAMRKLVEDGTDDNQDRLPFVEQREAVGHAVRMNYLCAGAADLYLETGDNALWTPLEAIWQNVIEKKLYITGACGALYDGASPDGVEEQGEIARVHQAYGRNYQLPNITAHNETCAAIGAVMWNWRMFLATGEAKYVDWLELAMYNAVLSGVSLDGTNYFYVNPLRNVDPLPVDLRWSRSRVPFIVSYCCPPNVVRTVAELSGYAYSKTDDAVFVNLYGSSRLHTDLADEPLELVQESEYPWNGRITIRVDRAPSGPWSLKLRIPGWAQRATVQVNDEQLVNVHSTSTYHCLRRTWKAGDTVELEIPMPAVLLEANPLVEETRNQLAVKRGPIVYCVESTDLPEGIDIDQVAVPSTAEFHVDYESELLGGVAVLSTQLVKRPSNEWTGLYRPVDAVDGSRFRGEFIPYFAWGNRGESEMTVWLPRE